MEYQRHRVLVFVVSLITTVANASSAYINATTTSYSSSRSASDTTSSRISVSTDLTTNAMMTTTLASLPSSCNAGTVCDREGQPTYSLYAEAYDNPYITEYQAVLNQSGAYSSLNDYCVNLWWSSMTEFLHTAPLTTYASMIPPSTTMIYQDGFTETLSTISVISTEASLYTETDTVAVFSGPAATSTFMTVYTEVDENGVETVITESEAFGETTYTTTEMNTNYVYSQWAIITSTQIGYTTIEIIPAHPAVGFVSEFSYVPTSPCCKECTLFGGDVQVYYWPSAAAAHPVSELTNSAKFTFTSPSVYVAFQSLYATDFCGSLGGVYNATSLAFKESDLSTAPGYSWDTVAYASSQPYLPPLYTAATWEDQKDCIPITKSFYQVVWTMIEDPGFVDPADLVTYDVPPSSWGPGDYIHYTVTYNPCSPTLSIPTELFTINTLWAGCFPGLAGFFDPPYALSSIDGVLSAFSATKSPATDSPVTTSGAAAGPSVTPVTPTATGSSAHATSTDPPAKVDPSTASVDPLARASTSTPNDPPAADPSSDPASQTPHNDPSTPLPPIQSQTSNPIDPTLAILTLGSITVTANSASAFIFASQTLTPGGKIMYSGTAISLDPSGNAIVIDGTTTQAIAHPTSVSVGSGIDPPAILTLGSSTITANSASEFVIASQTLTPGGQITYAGTVLSLDPDGSAVVIGGTTTQVLATGSSGADRSTTDGGLGGVIASIGGFGGDSSGSTTATSASFIQVPGGGAYNGTVFTGSAERLRSGWVLGVMVGIGVANIATFV